MAPVVKIPKSILITGASSGLGAALANAYAGSGITLCLTGRSQARLDSVAASCREKGAVVHVSLIDVTDKEKLAVWIQEMDSVSPIDLVIANAGISAGTGGGGETLEQASRIFTVNVEGVLNTIYPLIPHMITRRHGQIAVMGSLSAFRPLPGAPAYSASKAAVRFYGEALRGTLSKHGVGVTAICPGYIKTPMTAVNRFPMPFLMEVDKAARIIKQRLSRNPARVAFPFPLYALVWLLAALPPGWTDPLFARLPAKTSDT